MRYGNSHKELKALRNPRHPNLVLLLMTRGGHILLGE